MKQYTSIKRWTRNFIDLLFPRVCTVCHRTLVEGEDVMCIGCMADLPAVNHTNFFDNKLTERLISINAPIVKATSMYHYVAGTPYVRLIHDTKYDRRPIVGRKLARIHATQLKRQGFFDDVDVILPIPLHFYKLWRRGYNQSHEIALGLADISGLPIGDNLIATRHHATQTHKTASQRRDNTKGTIKVSRPEELDSLHILVVDDVITTGSTMLSALESIHKSVPSARLSVYSLALTQFSAT